MIENIQAILLALGIFVFLFPHQHNAYSSLQYALALLCFSFLLRELDVEKLDIPVILQTLGSGPGKRVLLLLLWGVVCWRVYHHELRVVKFTWKPILQSRQLSCLFGVLGFLAISYVMDKELVPFTYSRLYEELAETNAYLLLVASKLAAIIAKPAVLQA